MCYTSDYNYMISLHKIYAEDALELDAVLFAPEQKTDTLIIHVHGKEGHFLQNHFIGIMGRMYTEAGYAFLTFNNRGHDYMADMLRKSGGGFEWVKKGTVFDMIEEFPLDLNGVVAYVKELGYTKIILQGHSVAPHKIVYYLTHEPKHAIEKIILLSPADVPYLVRTYIPDWQTQAETARKMVEGGEEKKLMSASLWNDAPASAKTFWGYTRPDSDYWIFNYADNGVFKSVDQITVPTLAIFPENDFSIGVNPAAALAMLGEQMKNTQYASAVIPQTVHNYMGKEEELCRVILEWVKTN